MIDTKQIRQIASNLTAPSEGSWAWLRLFLIEIADEMEDKSAPPSQGKVERARDWLRENVRRDLSDKRKRTKMFLGICGAGIAANVADYILDLALTESSGQGTDGAEAMPAWPDLTFEQRRDISMLLQQTGGARAHYENVRNYLRLNVRALPLPVSADGSVTVPEALLSTCLGVLREMDKRCAVTGEDWENDYTLVVAQLRAFLKSKQPSDTKPVCSTYHSRAVGVACSNCGHPKEAHKQPDTGAGK